MIVSSGRRLILLSRPTPPARPQSDGTGVPVPVQRRPTFAHRARVRRWRPDQPDATLVPTVAPTHARPYDHTAEPTPSPSPAPSPLASPTLPPRLSRNASSGGRSGLDHAPSSKGQRSVAFIAMAQSSATFLASARACAVLGQRDRSSAGLPDDAQRHSSRAVLTAPERMGRDLSAR